MRLAFSAMVIKMDSSLDNRSRMAAYMPSDWGPLLSAFAAAYGIGWLSLLGLPFLIGAAMASLKLNEAQAGLLVTVEFVGIMLASLIAAPFMGRANRRLLASIGAIIALAANALSIFVLSYEWLIYVRPIAGLGAGITIACGNAAVSNDRDPERFAGQLSMLSVVLMVFIMLTFSRLSAAWGLTGVYAGIATIILMMSPLLRMLPSRPPMAHQASLNEMDRKGDLSTLCGILMLAAFFAFSLRDTLAWAFLETIGEQVGYKPQEIGNLLSVQAMLGIIGPLTASIVGSRFGIKLPLSIGIVLSGLVTYAISHSTGSKILYTAATTLQPGTYFFTLAYLTALAAELDQKGRIVAASGSALMAGVAIGPAVGGALIVASGNYSLVGWVIIGCVVATLLFAMIPIVSVESKRRAAAQSPHGAGNC
jgi:MFS family permease